MKREEKRSCDELETAAAVSVDATVAAVLTEPDGDFTLITKNGTEGFSRKTIWCRFAPEAP